VSKRGKRSGPHWRKRQGQDVYFRKAKQEGYRARSAYKLLQIQARFHILRPGQAVLDLGAAPGSWSQVTVEIVGPTGKTIAVDLLPIEPIPGVTILQGDITRPEVQSEIVQAAGGRVDVVLCDAAPNTSGIRDRDHALSIELAYTAFGLAQRLLKRGGHLVAKVFEGGDVPRLIEDLRQAFDRVKPYSPEATRAESREMFVVCQGYTGNDQGG
jgi:23S rRNA (uridine2552-2'-O)-methyltransferase